MYATFQLELLPWSVPESVRIAGGTGASIELWQLSEQDLDTLCLEFTKGVKAKARRQALAAKREKILEDDPTY